jgi:hypothetical protein
MEDERRAVLERVARGELSPAEAASLLEDIESRGSEESGEDRDPRDWTVGWQADAGTGATQPGGPEPPPGEAAARIRVVAMIGTADIVGDPTVREAVADGPHVARRDGDALVVEGNDYGFGLPGMQGFIFNWAGPERMQRMHRMHRLRRHRHGWSDLAPLRVRVNPDLPLEVDAQAGRVRIRGVHAAIRANVQAGSTDIEDFRGPLDLGAQAGSITARGRLDGGASRIHCDAGSVRLYLERGSSVRVTAHSTLGKVVFNSADARMPWVVGGGEGTLEIESTMGSVKVKAD